MMNIFFFISFSLGLGCITLGLLLLRKNQNTSQNIIFFLICCSLACLNLISIPAYSSDTKEEMIFWNHVSNYCVNLFYAFNLHFYIDLYYKKRLEIWKIVILYIPPFFVIAVFTLNPYLILDYVRYNGEWKLIPAYGEVWFYIASGYVILYSLLAVILMITGGRKAATNKEKLQARWIMINFLLSTGIGILGLWVLPFLNYTIPNIGPAYLSFYILGLFYSVLHFKFMDFNPSIAADEILPSINKMVLLLEPGLKVTYANKKCREMLSDISGEITGKNFSDLIVENDSIIAEITQILNDAESKMTCNVLYKSYPEPIAAFTFFSVIIDRFADVIGILVISSENRNRKLFQTTYKITDRELEVADFMIAGFTSREIGIELGISSRTVESHQEHIYQKTNVSGKIELIRLANKFSLSIQQ